MPAQHTLDLIAPASAGLYAVGGLYAQVAPTPELSWVGLLLQTGSAGMVLLTVYLFLDRQSKSDEANRQHQSQVITRVEQIQAAYAQAISEARAEHRAALIEVADRFEKTANQIVQSQRKE